MMSPVVQCVAATNPGWALLAANAGVGLCICALLWWILGKQYSIFREYLNGTRAFTSTAIEALRDIKNSCDRCHSDTAAIIKMQVGAAADEILGNMQAEHDSTREVIAAIGREEDRTVRALAEIKSAIERSNELLVSHINPPPALGVGSQVRDGGGTL